MSWINEEKGDGGKGAEEKGTDLFSRIITDADKYAMISCRSGP